MKEKKIVKLILALALTFLMLNTYANSSGKSTLSKKEGFLILDMKIGRPVAEISIYKKTNKAREKKTATRTFRNHAIGDSLRLVKLPAGKYQWNNIVVPHFNLPSRLDLTTKENTEFIIEAQKTNYVGRVLVEKNRGNNWVGVYILNRLSERLPEISRELGETLNRYPLVYSGSKRDDFLELIVNQESKNDE